MQPNYIPVCFLTSTPALDKALAQNAKAMAKVDQALATSNAIIDRAFHKANRVLDAATAKKEKSLISPHDSQEVA